MFKPLVFATLVAASCAVHAVPVWTFSYTGFLDENTGIFSSTYKLKGSFSGHDGNHDGFLDKDEISTFILNGVDYIGCAGTSNEFYRCGTDSFSFQIGSKKLDFSVGENGGDPEGYFGGGHYFVAGDGEYDYRYTPDSYLMSAYRWTDQTRFNIGKSKGAGNNPMMASAVLAVPEPGTWAMLATGLLLVAGAARRRAGTAQPVRN